MVRRGLGLRCKSHSEAPLVQLAREHPRVGDYLSCVGGPELFHLPEDLRRGGNPVPVGIVLDSPQETSHRAVEHVLSVREEQPPCGPGNDLCVLALRTSTPSNMGFWN